MRRSIVWGSVGLMALILALGAVKAVPVALANWAVFDVAAVRVEGTGMLSDLEVIETAAIPDTANVFDDASAWVAAVEAHPVVRRARVRRRLPSTLVIVIEERGAVAFVATPILEPVDAEGRILPVDPVRVRLDLPVVRLRPAVAGSDEAGYPPHRVRPQVDAIERLRQNPAFHERLSEVREESDGSVTAFWGSSPGLEVRLRLPVDPVRLETGLEVLSLALDQDSTRTPRYLDLRYAEQIIVGYEPQ